MPDTNIQVLLAKLPADSLARRLVEPFATQAPDAATEAAQNVLASVKTTHARIKAVIDEPA